VIVVVVAIYNIFAKIKINRQEKARGGLNALHMLLTYIILQ